MPRAGIRKTVEPVGLLFEPSLAPFSSLHDWPEEQQGIMKDWILGINSAVLKVTGHFLPRATCLVIVPGSMILKWNVHKNQQGACE